MGRRTLSGDPQSPGVIAGFDPSGDARDHRGRRAADRGRHLCRALSAAGAAAHRRAHLCNIDAMVLPTAPTAYSTAQVLANPIELNSRLGTYTNFVNLLDLCGLALPAAMRPDGIPFGITLLAPAGHDAQLASIGRVFHADTGLEDGQQMPDPAAARGAVVATERRRNRDRRGRRASLRHGAERRIDRRSADACSKKPSPRRTTSSTRSTPRRRNPACCASMPARDRRSSWSSGRCRRLHSENSSPRSRRRCRSAPSGLSDGRGVKGFIVEPAAINGARDISAFGGWRAFMAQKAVIVIPGCAAWRRARNP